MDLDWQNQRIFRSFGYLHVRALHYLQARLQILEMDLRDMDKHDWNTGWLHVLMSVEADNTEPEARRMLMSEIKAMLKEYGMEPVGTLTVRLYPTRTGINALRRRVTTSLS